ncbi:MAG: SDR family NAD(P)-dependent oxidoreductase [Peptococcaceae bacterium]|jgi:3-oxoacyl-[acyl-carrier protein] reductase|nr:SDR family NAD(P)-dependent oxidoreductase [Peptococcaceae bacterium]
MFDFTGKYVVVTGGNRGIGEAVVRRFLNEKAAGVAVLDVAEGLAYADPSEGGILYIGCDITNRPAVASAFEQIYAKFGRVDVLVNNAGITRDGMFHKMSDDNWDSVINVDLGGAYNCTRQVINRMRGQAGGRIIFISSISFYGNVGQANYASAKGALVSLTKTLARESARKNITVNCLLPAAIETGMLESLHYDKNDPNGPRMGKPENVASLICYLCSDEADFINGACIDINGGAR